jgi:hypothetical protein
MPQLVWLPSGVFLLSAILGMTTGAVCVPMIRSGSIFIECAHRSVDKNKFDYFIFLTWGRFAFFVGAGFLVWWVWRRLTSNT